MPSAKTSHFLLRNDSMSDLSSHDPQLIERIQTLRKEYISPDHRLLDVRQLINGVNGSVDADQQVSELTRQRLHLFLETLKQKSGEFTPRVEFKDVGTVQHIGSGVARLSGFQNARTDELVIFPTGVRGLVLNLNRRYIDVVLLGSDEGIRGGDMVTTSGERLLIPVGSSLLGRVINPLGVPLDDGGPIQESEHRYLEREAPGIVDRAPVNEPLQTGLKIIDALIPLGRGQRELIVGERQTGKTAIAVDAIINQKGNEVDCIYVAIGQKKSSTLEVIEKLRRAGAMSYTTVVMSGPDEPPAIRYLAPYAGSTLAEYLMDMGRDVLIVYDDLSKHADAYRELSLLLRRPPGREAYPGDIFYLHSRLLERACKLSPENGGGSITALPIVSIQQRNISAYIPTNLISITDGQIILDAGLFNRGVKPAVDVGRSVSRVGGKAQTTAMRAVAGDVRLELAQYEEVARFARFGTEVNQSTLNQIERGKRLQQVLIQQDNKPFSLSEQITILYAAVEGHLSTIPVDDIDDFEEALLLHIHHDHAAVYHRINRTSTLDDELREQLDDIILIFRESWMQKREEK